MNKATSEEAVVQALNEEYITYIERLRAAWLTENRVHSRDVYEVMRQEERDKVHACIARWAVYVTPFAEAWWKERGYGVSWPEDNSEPMKIFKLEAA